MAITQQPKSCEGCALSGISKGFMSPEGKGSLGVLLVGEAAGEHEMRDSLPFRPQAQAGSVLERAIKRMGLSREQFVISNVINCRPKDNKLEGEWYEQAAIEHCKRNLGGVVERFAPRAIVALGNIPLRALTGTAGPGRTVTALRGYCLPATTYTATEGKPIPVIPTYHPSFISRGNEHLLGVLMHDLGKAIKVASGKLVEGSHFLYDPLGDDSDKLKYYYPVPSEKVDELLEAASDPNALIAYDIETAFTGKGKGEDEYEMIEGDEIVQIQFSLRPGEACIFPWSDAVRELSRKILGGCARKVSQNGWRFDQVKLRAEGVRVAGEDIDVMTAFHHLQPDLPADLQFIASMFGFPFPWKHLGTKDLTYAGADVDALQRIMQKLPEDMRKRGVWDSYVEMVLGLQPILEGMQTRGIRLDLEAREQFRVEIEEQKKVVNTQLQAEVPEVVKPRKVYKDWPDECKEYLSAVKEANIIIGKKGGKRLPVVTMGVATADHHIALTIEQRRDLVEQLGKQWRYDNGSLHRVDLFLPNSTAHLKKLIVHFGEKVPKNLDDDDTTARPELEKLIEKLHKEADKLKAKKRPTDDDLVKIEQKLSLVKLIEQSIEYRQLNKIGSTYIEGWQPDSNGLVHTTYTFSPASWQLAAIRPNVMNAPVHSELAKKFKKLQVASSGCTLIAADYSACHLKTLAFEAEDISYYRMACIDGHSTVAALMLKLVSPEKLFSMEDGELRDYFKWLKSDKDRLRVRNKQAKPCIAEGELVLTQRGLVPIQAVSIDDRLWDGVEWVSHGGVVCLGEKEIIEYDGLKATPDHEVYTACKRKVSLREAASGSLRLERSGDDWKAIRTDGCYISDDQTGAKGRQQSARETIASLPMSGLWREGLDRSLLAKNHQGEGLQEVRRLGKSDSSLQENWSALRRHSSSLLQSDQSSFSSLRWAGDQMQLQLTRALHQMDSGEPAARELQRSGNRSNRQRRALRAWELAAGFEVAANAKQVGQCMDELLRRASVNDRVPQSIYGKLDETVGARLGNDWRADNRTGEGCGEKGHEELARATGSFNKVRVYDILNSGPRHRFTVSGKLVSNCLLGIQLGLGARKLFDLNRGSFDNQKEAQDVIDLIKRIYPNIPKWQQHIKDLAHRQGFLAHRYGGIRWFWNVQRWDAKNGRMTAGDDAERALAYPVQGDAFGKMREAMLDLEIEGLAEKYRLNNNLHDALYFDCPNEYLEEAISKIKEIMERPARKLVNKTFPDGLVIGVEINVGPNLGELKEVKL